MAARYSAKLIRSSPTGGAYLRIVEHSTDKICKLGVSLKEDRPPLRSYSSVAADLIDLAAVLHVLDRAVPRGEQSKVHVEVDIPLRNPSAFRRSREELQTALRQYSHDRWSFTFSKSSGEDPRPERALIGESPEAIGRNLQPQLFRGKGPLEVALFSGGLDSFAGLIHRMRQRPETDFLLVGSGSNREVIGLQKRLNRALRREVGRSRPAFRLQQTRIHPDYPGDSPPFGSFNTAPRLRGLVFTLIGAGQAVMYEQDRLHVYENGIGAINLPFGGGVRKSDHATAVHPKSLRKAGNFLSAVLGEDFEVSNPFLFKTKSQMCESIADLSWASRLASQTISCDSKPRESYRKQVRHCGTCSSCLLRRLSFMASSLRDQTDYAFLQPGYEFAKDDRSHWRGMRSQAREFGQCLRGVRPWPALANSFPNLEDVRLYAPAQGRSSAIDGLADEKDKTEENLADLYRRHVEDWNRFGDQIRPRPLLPERHERSPNPTQRPYHERLGEKRNRHATSRSRAEEGPQPTGHDPGGGL